MAPPHRKKAESKTVDAVSSAELQMGHVALGRRNTVSARPALDQAGSSTRGLQRSNTVRSKSNTAEAISGSSTRGLQSSNTVCSTSDTAEAALGHHTDLPDRSRLKPLKRHTSRGYGHIAQPSLLARSTSRSYRTAPYVAKEPKHKSEPEEIATAHPVKDTKQKAESAGAAIVQAALTKHCYCEVPHDEFMFKCITCRKLFHLGCIGQGEHDVELYDTKFEDEETVSERHAHDHAARSAIKRLPFSCAECKTVSSIIRNVAPLPEEASWPESCSFGRSKVLKGRVTKKTHAVLQGAIISSKHTKNNLPKKPKETSSRSRGIDKILKQVKEHRRYFGVSDETKQQNKVRVQARVEMEKRFGVHKSQDGPSGLRMNTGERRRRKSDAAEAGQQLAAVRLRDIEAGRNISNYGFV